MGCYDTIEFHCPDCGEIIYAQSKGGERMMENYKHTSVPDDVASDCNRHSPVTCHGCGSKWEFEYPRNICLTLRKVD